MNITRRHLLILMPAAAVAWKSVLAGTPEAAPNYTKTDRWWGMLIDIPKCIGCGNCVRACQAENDVPDGFFRTWVERYHVTGWNLENPQVISPDGGREGFPPVADDPDGKYFFVRDSALGSESFKAAAKALIGLAPKCQIVVDGKLGWDTAEQGQADDVKHALFLLRTVRNNLFHGRKYEHGGPVQDVARDTEILTAALALLGECYKLNERVETYVDQLSHAA